MDNMLEKRRHYGIKNLRLINVPRKKIHLCKSYSNTMVQINSRFKQRKNKKVKKTPRWIYFGWIILR